MFKRRSHWDILLHLAHCFKCFESFIPYSPSSLKKDSSETFHNKRKAHCFQVLSLLFLTALHIQNKITLNHIAAFGVLFSKYWVVYSIVLHAYAPCVSAFNVQNKITLNHMTAKGKRIVLKVLSFLFLTALRYIKKTIMRHFIAFGALPSSPENSFPECLSYSE